ncbi:hypothetical protein ACGFW5_22660 [Streptomyces sp. NPDC048416]|uniref:hypothetical protein n=1 Tax=Streptomyces sp. NPDC048416 TaxID=3365546 RepID=UPI0037111A5F
MPSWALTGCGTGGSTGSSEVPFAGIGTTPDAADAMEKASSELYDVIARSDRGADNGLRRRHR